MHARGVPRSIHGAGQRAEGNVFRNESLGSSGRDGIANGLKVRGHLAGEHFDEAGAVHADGLALVGESLLSDEAAELVESPRSGHGVAVIEGNEVETLTKDEDICYAVAASTG